MQTRNPLPFDGRLAAFTAKMHELVVGSADDAREDILGICDLAGRKAVSLPIHLPNSNRLVYCGDDDVVLNCVTLPTIMQSIRRQEGVILATASDVACAQARKVLEANGYATTVFDLRAPQHSAQWNILTEIHFGDSANSYASGLMSVIWRTICSNTMREPKGRAFRVCMANLLTDVAHLLYDEEKQTGRETSLPRFIDIISQVRENKGEYDSQTGIVPDRDLSGQHLEHLYNKLDPMVRSEVVEHAYDRLEPLCNHPAMRIFASSDFYSRSLGEGASAAIILLPAEGTEHGLFSALLIRLLLESALWNGRESQNMNFILENHGKSTLGTLGQIPDLRDKLYTSRYQHARVTMTVSDPARLHETLNVYKNDNVGAMCFSAIQYYPEGCNGSAAAAFSEQTRLLPLGGKYLSPKLLAKTRNRGTVACFINGGGFAPPLALELNRPPVDSVRLNGMELPNVQQG